ncbi:MAG: bifunctional 2',3'-cyclic-nucleotide 2'-phosphodiesterase/3'-nucleotidase [Rhodobacterales bacterium]|nr:MAG: bifunctional 2',3'-cyclic-nucleotide 2'-phosphodiesterase/3'-nucleotidase [Rhodobacterales bacterium]
METTDLHMHVFPYDYYSDSPRDTVGLARTASLIKGIRDQAANSLLLDNGDFLQGNPMGDYIAYERGLKEGDLHPIIAAMNTVGFDAATLGNHEFNYGLEFLTKAMAGAQFPVVSANVATRLGRGPRQDQTLFKPYVILNRTLQDGAGRAHPVKIGVIGFAPPQIVNWDRRHLEGRVIARDIIATARAYVPEMKETGCDLIIALSHSGIAEANTEEGLENASLQLALVDGIDAILCGHQHLVFPGPRFAGMNGVDNVKGALHGKPAVMGGFWGSHLGVIDLLLERSGNDWKVLDFTSETQPISQRNPDNSITALVPSQQDVLDSVAKEHDETLAYIRRGVGKTAAPLHSYFALVANDPTLQITTMAQQSYITEMLKGTEYADLPVLSAAAPFKAGGHGGPDYYTDVAIGDVAIKNISDIYIHPNVARAVKINGAQLKAWLECSAGIFNQIEPGNSDQELLNPAFPSYNFDVIYGVTYEIDLSQPPRFSPRGWEINPNSNRIVNLKYDGKPVDDQMEFVIATNDYRASGGNGLPGTHSNDIIFEAPDTNRDLITRYIVEQGTINLQADQNWSFKPLPETTVLFDTGPKARDYLEDIKGLEIEPAGAGPDGFARFRIRL